MIKGPTSWENASTSQLGGNFGLRIGSLIIGPVIGAAPERPFCVRVTLARIRSSRAGAPAHETRAPRPGRPIAG